MGKYDEHSREQLIKLLEKRDRDRKLGLVWERDEIEADKAVDANFVVATLDETLSDRVAPWRNLVIEGDNYDALRWLRMCYAGKVKCIYVDPPYNTGNKDWVYNDSFVDKENKYRFSMWLEFLFRRFTLARDLLTEDGVILVSINDENRALMELMLDDALPGMKLGSFVWRTRVGSNADQGSFLSRDHEHVLVYGHSKFEFKGQQKSLSIYSNKDGDLRGDWTSDNPTLGFNRFERPNLYYPIHDPREDVWYPCNPNAVWRFASRSRVKPGQKLQVRPMEELIEDGRILFPKEQRVGFWNSRVEALESIANGDVPSRGKVKLIDEENLDFWIGKKIAFGAIRVKRFKDDLKNLQQPLSSWISFKSDALINTENVKSISVGSNDEAAKTILSVFGKKAFNYAKPVSLLRELIRQSTSSGDLVLDFFAGSATTAQAVMELNAEDGGDRRFIMASSTEKTNDDPDKNLCRDVTAERVRRLSASDDKKYAELAAEFAYLKIREIDFENIDYDLKPAEAWNTLEAVHGLPLTAFEASMTWNEHVGEIQAMIYVDKVTEPLLDRVQTLKKQGLGITMYSWSPGQLRDRLRGLDVEIQHVRPMLVKRFQQ
jgi:adenine-specific DNA-methyltransferase